MEYEAKFDIYQWSNELREHADWFSKRYVGVYEYWDEYIEALQDDFLTQYSEFQDNESIRLRIMLPLIEYEIETGALTPELREEFEIYYEDYNNGKLDGLLKRSEDIYLSIHFHMCNSRKDYDMSKLNYQDHIEHMKYFKFHTGAYNDDGTEKTFNPIPLYENDIVSLMAKKISLEMCGESLPDGYSLRDDYGYVARKNSFFEECKKLENDGVKCGNVAEWVLNKNRQRSVIENGMCRFVNTLYTLLWQIENNRVTDHIVHLVKWSIDAFEKDSYVHVFDEEDLIPLQNDIKFVKEYITQYINDKRPNVTIIV